MNFNLKERILELRKSGKTYNEIISELKCAKSTVSYHCSKLKKIEEINNFGKNITEDDINLIITLKKEGKTNIEIRKITSINEDKILKICKSNDLKLYTHYLLPTENDLLILQKKYEELKNIKKVHESFGGKYSHSFLRKNIKKTKRIKSEIERKEKKML